MPLKKGKKQESEMRKARYARAAELLGEWLAEPKGYDEQVEAALEKNKKDRLKFRSGKWMKLVLDTNILGKLCHPNSAKNRPVAEWMQKALKRGLSSTPSDCYCII